MALKIIIEFPPRLLNRKAIVSASFFYTKDNIGSIIQFELFLE